MDVKEREPAAVDQAALPPELMIVAGNHVLNEHTDDAGLCAVCGSAWPCSLTKLTGSRR